MTIRTYRGLRFALTSDSPLARTRVRSLAPTAKNPRTDRRSTLAPTRVSRLAPTGDSPLAPTRFSAE